MLAQQHQQASKSQLAGKPKKSLTKASPVPTNVDDYPYVNHNTVASDAASALKLLQINYEHLESLLPKPLSGSYANVNFEFAGDAIPIPDANPLSELEKYIEVKEIRSRGQVTGKKGVRRGVFSLQYIDIGQAICEFCGHVVRIESLYAKSHKVTTVSQTFVLFPSSKADVVIDSRRHGSQARWVRRSCRPNSIVKAILHKGNVFWYLFAKQTIKPGDELFLPLDWDTGNRLFRYECACNSPETCLAPDELLPEGYRENLLQREDLSTVASIDLVSASFSSHSDRKLSREEKKLQRYIEAFEKLESAERKKSRTTPPSSSPETSRKQSAQPAQAPTKPLSTIQSKKKSSNIVATSAIPMKKIWASKQSKKVKQESPEPLSHSSLSSEVTTPTTEDELAEEIHDESVTIGPREETPVSQLVSDEATSSSAKRLSLSDFLHRKISQIHIPLTQEDKAQDMDVIHEEHEDVDSKEELSSSSSSRESGEYIEAPSFSPIKYKHHSPSDVHRERSQSPHESYDYNQNQPEHTAAYAGYDYYDQYHHRTSSVPLQPGYHHQSGHQYNYNRQQQPYYDYDDPGYYQQQLHYPPHQHHYRPQSAQQHSGNFHQYEGYYEQSGSKRPPQQSGDYHSYPPHDSQYYQGHPLPLQSHHITNQQHSSQSTQAPRMRPPPFRPRHNRPPPSRDKPPGPKKDRRDFHPSPPPSSNFR
jgi:hypothetical protein